MAQSDNDGRRSEPSPNASVLADTKSTGSSAGDTPEASQSDDRQWTLRRIEGVIGSVA